MASPLELFRKNQKVLMVPLTILAMFAFIVMDQLTPNQFPPILGMLVFGALFWYLGKERGKGTLFAVIGMVLGYLVGYTAMPRMGAAMVVSTNAGDIDQQEFQTMVKNRQIANQFVISSYFESLPEEERERARPPQGAMFGFGRESEDDIILEFLFRKEADKMNLVVSDNSVSQYISRYTSNKLSRDAFREVCQRMGVTEGQIYDILRDQLKAKLAFQLLLPSVSLTPDQYWGFYKKFNVREELEVVALPVKDFESEVAAPTDAEKKAFYEQYKGLFPNQTGPGSPGLRQPQRVQVEYLMADYEETEKQVPPVTDAEIKAFYEENKERLYKNNPIPDSPNSPAPKAPNTPATPQNNGPVEAEKPEMTEKKPAAPKSTPAKETKPVTPEKPQETPKAKPEEKPAAKPEKKEESSALGSTQTTFVSFLDEKPKESPAEADKPGTPAEKPKPAEPEAKPAETKPEETKPAEPTTASAPLEPYRPLNDDLKSEIRDQLLRERTLALMKEKITGAVTYMNDLSYKINSPAEGETPPTTEEVTKMLKAYADKHQLVYNITPMMSAQEMEESEKYPLGTAKEPTANQFAAQPRSVIEQLFETPVDLLYSAYEAEDAFSSALISYWKVKHVDASIPEFDDPKIQEEIVAQLKLEAARPVAQKRGEALKKLIVDAGDKEMSEAISGQTVTGKKEGTELSTTTTESFSWMRTSTAGASNPFSMPRPELSSISAIDGAGNEFMEQIFDNMSDGDVGVVMNADKSICYVVKVKNRIPSTEGGMTAMYQEFLKTDLFFFFSPYLPLAQMEQQQTNYEWSRDLEEKYQVQKFFQELEATEERVE